jgi:hypothetical protein
VHTVRRAYTIAATGDGGELLPRRNAATSMRECIVARHAPLAH